MCYKCNLQLKMIVQVQIGKEKVACTVTEAKY